MPLSNLRNRMSGLSERAGDLGKFIGPGAAFIMAQGGYHQKLSQGYSIPTALASQTTDFALSILSPGLHLWMSMGVPAVRAATSAVIDSVNARNAFTQSVKTPFSHRFEHTDTTALAQQRGLQAIGASFAHANQAAEAAAFARRYSRR